MPSLDSSPIAVQERLSGLPKKKVCVPFSLTESVAMLRLSRKKNWPETRLRLENGAGLIIQDLTLNLLNLLLKICSLQIVFQL